MKDYTKDPSIPAPLASLLNHAQGTASEADELRFELKAARHQLELADEQINRRKALFQKIAEIAEELERAARERGLFREIENREPIIDLRRIAEIARAASGGK